MHRPLQRMLLLKDSLSSHYGVDTTFFDTVSGGQEKACFMITTITVKDIHISFKLDTGAEATATTNDAYHLLGKPQLNTADKILCGPSRHPLGVMGSLSVTLQSR